MRLTSAGKESVIDSLKDVIQVERNRVAASYPHEEVSLKRLLIELVRAIDCYYVSGSKRHDDAEFRALYTYGWSETAGILYEDCAAKGPFPLFPSTNESWEWANSAIQHCGRVAFLRQMISFREAGLANIEGKNDTEIVIGFKASDCEGIDREAYDWFIGVIRDKLVKPGMRHLENTESLRVHSLLKSNVDRWKDHFIQYTTTPEIDKYFEAKGHLSSLAKIGRDNFPATATFGGIAYRDYCVVVEAVIGISLKHIEFCAALCEKHDDIDLRNIISIPISRSEFVTSLSMYLDMATERIQGIVDCLTLSPENHVNCTRFPQEFPPPFIRVGDDSLIHSVTGSLAGPYAFLNRELRRRYEKDFFVAVNGREAIFREQLYSLFKGDRFQKTPQRIMIGRGKSKTDVDAAIFDMSVGTLGLFQLKWQEVFGSSLRERDSRLKNFYPDSIKWIDKLASWIRENTPSVILSSLHFNARNPLNKVLFFVVNRNAVFFTGAEPDHRATWATFYQFVRSFSEIPVGTADVLSNLQARLVNNSPAFKKRRPLKEMRFQLGGLTFVLQDAFAHA